MKKILSVLLCLLLVFSFSACGAQKPQNAGEKGKPHIVTTIFPPYDFARNITGGLASLTLLLPPGGESHSYEPSPKDMITIQECDLFIYVGGESDKWIDDILKTLDTSAMKIIKLMDCVETVYKEIREGMEDVHEEDGAHAEDGYAYDEHVWTSPKNAMKITQAIADTLCTLDEKNAQSYKENCTEYLTKLRALDGRFHEAAAAGKRNVMLFGDRFPFRYFTDEFDLDYYAAFPGCSSETEPSAATLAFLIDEITENRIPVVFYIEMSSQKVADTLCESTGAQKLLFHSCHNLTKEEFENGETYLSLMENNLKNLKTALG